MTGDLVIISRQLVSQETGFANPSEITSPAAPTTLNATSGVDIEAVDIGMPIDTGNGTPELLTFYGDVFGSEWQFFVNGAHATNGTAIRTIHSSQAAVALSTLTGSQSLKVDISAGPIGQWPASYGMICIEAAGAPGGWATITFLGRTTTGNVCTLTNCFLLTPAAGAFVISPGVTRISSGNPRATGGFRPNALSHSLDTTLSNGRTFSSWETTNGVADAVIPITRNVQDLAHTVYNFLPGGNGTPSTFLEIASIVKNGFTAEITFTAPHHLELGRARPTGYCMYFGGYSQHWAGTLDPSSAGISLASMTGSTTLLLRETSGTIGSATNRLELQTSTLGRAVIEYTGESFAFPNRVLTGCKWISGALGTTVANYPAYQGMQTLDHHDFVLWDVLSATKVSLLLYGNAAVGGDALPAATVYGFFPNNLFTAAPATAPKNSYVAMGGFSVARTGGRRICVFMQSSTAAGYNASYETSLDLWYSDSNGVIGSWVQSSVQFVNTATCDHPIQGLTLRPHPDGYAYGISNPGMVEVRVLQTDVLIQASYQFYNRTTSSWQSTIPAAVDRQIPTSKDIYGLTWWSDSSNNTVDSFFSTYWNRWIHTYTSLLFGGIQMRSGGPNFTDPKSAPRTIYTLSDFLPSQYLIYGGWIDPWSEMAGNGLPAGSISVIFTLYASYNTYRATLQLFDPGVEDLVSIEHGEEQVNPKGGLLTGPKLAKPSLGNWRAWIRDDRPWTRSGTNAFTVPVDLTAVGDDDLKVGAKIMVGDGTAIRKSVIGAIVVSSGVSTCHLINHNDGASAGNIFSAGTLDAPGTTRTSTHVGPHYCFDDDPPAWPAAFTYTPSSITGYSSNPTGIYTWAVRGHKLSVVGRETVAGTSNATSKQYALPTVNGSPIAALTRTGFEWYDMAVVTDPTAGATVIGRATISSAGTTISVFPGMLGNWANGTARVNEFKVECELP